MKSFVFCVIFFSTTLMASITGLDLKTEFQDQNGKWLSFDQLPWQNYLLAIAYTSCEDTCPMVVREIAQIQDKIKKRGQGLPVVLVSIDPLRDTPEKKLKFMKAHHLNPAEWMMLSARDDRSTRLFASSLDMSYGDMKQSKNHVKHSTKLFSIRDKTTIHGSFDLLPSHQDEIIKGVLLLSK